MDSPNYMDLELQFAGSQINLRMGPDDYHSRHSWNTGRHCNADFEVHIMMSGSCTLVSWRFSQKASWPMAVTVRP